MPPALTSFALAAVRRSARALAAGLLLVTSLAVLAGPVTAQDADDADPAGGEDSEGFTIDLGVDAADAVEPGDDAPAAEGPPAAESDPADDEPAAAPEPVLVETEGVQVLQVDTDDHPRVQVVVAVPPALAGELPAEAFSLTENGRVRSLDVAKLRDAIEVVLVVDTSGSMGGEAIAAAKAAASEFVSALPADTRIAVVGFGATADTMADFGATREAVQAAIDGLEADGETALYDALGVAVERFQDEAARRFVVVLSDGRDTVSATSLQEASGALAAADANLYAVTLESEDADFSGLETLVGDIDGQILAAADTSELALSFGDIASRLTNQYHLVYESQTGGTAALGIAVDANGVIAVASTTVELPALPGAEASAGGPTPGATEAIDTSNPRVTVTPEVSGMLDSDDAIYMGAAIVFAGVALALFVAMSAKPKGPSAFDRLNFRQVTAKRGSLANIADRASMVADRILEKQEKRGALDSALERAGLDMRPGEYVMAALGVAVGLAALGFVLFSPAGAVVAFGVGLLGARFYVNMKASRRRKQFANQLGDTLMMIAGSLRAGHGIAEAIDAVATQSDAPTGEEFSRAVGEARIGRDMVDSLYDIAERTQCEDFIWVVRAIGINRELGGDLAEILDNVGETIRDRNRLRDQVKALSAEGKVSAMILFALPICVGGWVRMSNPDYLDAMTGQTAGKILMGLAVLALVIGGLWLKKLVKVDF